MLRGQEQENTATSLTSSRQNLSANRVLSLKKTKEIEDRKKRVIACNKDSLHRQVEIWNRAKLR